MRAVLALARPALVWSLIGFGPQALAFDLPAAFGPESRLYRGTSERQIDIRTVLLMLARPESREVAPSVRMTTLRGLHPDWDTEKLRAAIDADLEQFRKKPRLLQNMAACHSFMEDCPLPGVSTMLGASFTAPIEPFPPEVPPNSFGDYPANSFRYKPYDPVISTSASRVEAAVFVLSPASFLLELADPAGRHCPQEVRSRSSEACITWHTEYQEELEYPWFGYIQADELRAVEQGYIRITRGSDIGRLRLTRIGRDERPERALFERIHTVTEGSKRLLEEWERLPECGPNPAPPVCRE